MQAIASPINLSDVSCSTASSMEPQYQVTFTLPTITSAGLVLRFYQAWGDGSSTGWKTPVNVPIVTLDGQSLEVYETFSYASPNFKFGSYGIGYDEYAQYLTAVIPAIAYAGAKLTISGSFQQVAYMSATVYGYGEDGSELQLEKLDNEYTTLNGACNPYQMANPSVFAYSATTTMGNQLTTKINPPAADKLPVVATNNASYGKLNIYRLNRQDSMWDIVDDIANDGCAQDYLYARKTSADQKVMVLRIKLPSTFINDYTPDKIFGDYQTRYFSVSANVDTSYWHEPPPPLGYWGVNARMLAQYVDNDGYVYVFFAPNSYVRHIATQQGVPVAQPPVITWGRYQGYLLGDPSFAILLRYMDPNQSWVGSPAHAICYNTRDDLKPLANNELGDYTPEIYADTMANFMQGNIGAVNKNSAWPN